MMRSGLSDGTVISAEAAQRVEDANKAWERMGELLNGIKNTITVSLAPAIEIAGVEVQGLIPSATHVSEAMEVIGRTAIYSAIAVGKLGSTMESIATLGMEGKFDLNLGKSFTEGDNIITAMKTTMAAAAAAAHKGGKQIGEEAADGLNEGKEKLEKITADFTQTMNEIKFSSGAAAPTGVGGGWGAWLKAQGVDEAAIKKIFEAANTSGVDPKVIESLSRMAVAEHQMKEAAKGSDALNELHDQLKNLQDAAAQGINPKYGEQIEKLHFNAEQASRYIAEMDAKKAIEEHFKGVEEISKKVEEAKNSLAAAKAGMTKDEYSVQMTDPASARMIKSLHDRETAIRDAAKAATETRKHLEADAAKTMEDMRTPMEKYRNELAELDQQLKANLITQETYDRAKAAAFNKEQKAKQEQDKKADNHFATEERRFTMVLPSTGADKTHETLKQQLEVQKQIERWTRDSPQ